jgi:hypothetical protein
LKKDTAMSLPKRRTKDIVVRDLGDETLVYDLKQNTAHCLNKTAAWVWKLCNGKTSDKEMAAQSEAKLGQKLDPEVVQHGLNQLGKARLLLGRTLAPSEGKGFNRREWIRKAGIAAAIVPVVMTMTAPPAEAQATGMMCNLNTLDCTLLPTVTCTGTTTCQLVAGQCICA